MSAGTSSHSPTPAPEPGRRSNITFPPSVPTLKLHKNRGGRPITAQTRALREAERLGFRSPLYPDTEYSDEDATSVLEGALLGHGQEGSARLDLQEGRWGWEFPLEHGHEHADVLSRRMGLGQPRRLIPALRELENDLPAVDEAASLEYVRQMCSKYEHLGLEELVLPELQAISGSQGPGEKERCTMCILQMPNGSLCRTVLLYAGGELGNELCIGSFALPPGARRRDRAASSFLASCVPLERYPTAILQITSSSPNQKNGSFTLVMRLHSSTHLYVARPNARYSAEPESDALRIEHVATLTTEETGGKRHCDIAVHPDERERMVVVDESGAVWAWTVKEKGEVSVFEGQGGAMRLELIRPGVTDSRDIPFRVALGVERDAVLVVSDRDAIVFDVQSSEAHHKTIVNLPFGSRFIDIDSDLHRDSQYRCLLTNREIIWVDEEAGTPSILSWKHDMNTSQGLLMFSFVHAETRYHILHTPSLNVLTIFQSSLSHPLRLQRRPYALTVPLGGQFDARPFSSIEFTIANLASSGNAALGTDLILIGQSADGSIRCWRLVLTDGGLMRRDAEQLKVIWDEGLKDVAEVGPRLTLPEDGVEKRGMAKRMYDARWAWALLNEPDDDASFRLEPKDLAQYMRELDAPFEHFMTGAELARDAVLSPDSDRPQPRSHLLRSLLLASYAKDDMEQFDSVRLDQDHVRVLPRGLAARHIDGRSEGRISRIKETLKLLNENYPPPEDPSAPALGSVFETPAVVPSRYRNRHIRDNARLALDLVLSSVVLSSEDLPTAPAPESAPGQALTPEDVLAQAAKLTLEENEPPEVTFHFAPPRPDHSHEEAGVGGAETVDVPEGTSRARGGKVIGEYKAMKSLQQPTIRHLLADWTPGADPVAYEWRPWITPARSGSMEAQAGPGAGASQGQGLGSTQRGDRTPDRQGTGTSAGAGAGAGSGLATQHTLNRPIRPLPSPRGSPRPRQEASAPVFEPSFFSQAQTQGQGGSGYGHGYGYSQRNAPPVLQFSLPNLPSRPLNTGAGARGVPGVLTQSAASESASTTRREASPRSSPPRTPSRRAVGQGIAEVSQQGQGQGQGWRRGPGVITDSGTGTELFISQEQNQSQDQSQSQSQAAPAFAATQIERGPYGGRDKISGAAAGLGVGLGVGVGNGEGKKKKKVVKKRVGGF